MTFEERRRKLKLGGHNWGDLPQRLPHHVENTNTKARAMPLAQFDLECASVLLDAMPSSKVKRAVSPFRLPITTVGWSLSNILESSHAFLPVPRIAFNEVDMQTEIGNYEKSGVPVIIEGLHEHEKWPKYLFNIDSFKQEVKEITARNIYDRSDSTFEISDFIAKCRASPPNTFPEEQERLYGKDAECPEQWAEWLHRAGVIPLCLLPDAQTNLLRNLPRSSPVETLMCYLGIGDTFTPCHKDLCASSGQNLMCYTEEGGSSFWFMTKGSDAPKVSEYFHKLNQELDHETHVITLEQLAAAPFCVYIAEQQLGDLVLVPPRSCHQVVNHGGITIKTSWSRMTLKGLLTSYYHELPIYRRVCRPEIYQVKSTIYHTLLQYTTQLEISSIQKTHSSPLPNLVMDIKALLGLFEDILIEEYSPDHLTIPCQSSPQPHAASPSPSNASSVTLTPDGKDCDVLKDPDGHITCDFCGGDVFHGFFECRYCVEQNTLDDSEMNECDEAYVVCAGCYVEGRSCSCGRMMAMQRQPFDNLLQLRHKTFKVLHMFTQDASFLSDLKQKPYLLPNTGVFRAARVLEQTRKHKRETKACAKSKDSSHIVSFSWALSCKKCHSAKCFAHLLDQRIHSADAILYQTSDESHEHYHKCHLGSKSAYHNATQALLKSREEGVRPDHGHQRVHAALTYRVCKPANPNLSLMSPGWYDMEILSTSFSSDGGNDVSCNAGSPTDTPRPPSTRPALIPRPTFVLTLSPPASASSPQTSTSLDRATTNLTTLKRKSCVLDFVLVPTARYAIKRKLSDPHPSSNTPKPGFSDVPQHTKPSMSESISLEKHNKAKEVRPIPRRKPTVAKSMQPGSISSKQIIGKSDVLVTSPNQPPSVQGPKRDLFLEEQRRRNTIKGLSFKKNLSKKTDGAQRSLNHSSSLTCPSSSTASIGGVDGGIEIARALNYASANNHHSSVDTDIVHDISEPRPPTKDTEVAEGSTDNAAIRSELSQLREQVSHLSTQVSKQASQVPPPEALNYFLNQNPSQSIVCYIVPQTGQFWPQVQSVAEGGQWHQGNHLNQAQNPFNQGPRGPPYGYSGGPARPRFNGYHQAGSHHHRSQPRQGQYARHEYYRQRSDHHHHHHHPQMTPNGHPEQPHNRSHHWDRGRRPYFSEPAPMYRENQEHFNGCSPGRSIPYHHTEWQQGRAPGFTRAVQPVHDTSPSDLAGQCRQNFRGLDVWERGNLNKQAIETSQEELLRPNTEDFTRSLSIPADSPNLQSLPTYTVVENETMYEPIQENNSHRRSPHPSAQWEDGYEQEDPVVPAETIFKSSANHPCKLKDALVDPSFNPWQ